LNASNKRLEGKEMIHIPYLLLLLFLFLFGFDSIPGNEDQLHTERKWKKGSKEVNF